MVLPASVAEMAASPLHITSPDPYAEIGAFQDRLPTGWIAMLWPFGVPGGDAPLIGSIRVRQSDRAIGVYARPIQAVAS